MGIKLTGMDDTSSLGSLGSLPDSPLSNFIGASGEKAAQAQALAHGGDNLRQCRLRAKLLALLISFGIGLEASQAILKGD